MNHAATMQRLCDLINTGNIDGFGRLMADNIAEREELPGIPPTKAGAIQNFKMLVAAFPDLHMAAEDVLASGDKSVARVRVTGTHKGSFMGMAATGRPVDVQLIDIIRFGDDGLAREHWGVIDQLAMMQQLGAMPA
jgi:predicted ester cyclase